MGLADFFHQLIPKRWKDKIDSPSLDETPGFSGGTLGQQISPDRMSGVASSPVENQIRPILARTDTDVSPSSLPQPIVPLGPHQSGYLPAVPNETPSSSVLPQPVTPTALSQVGKPPAPMEWNPIVRNPQTGKPSISPTATGDQLDMATRERDALSQWSPHRHRGVVNTLEGAGRGFLVGGLPGAVAGGVGSIIQPNLTGRLERSSLLNQANENVDRLSTEAQQRIARDNAEIRPQLEQAKLDQTAAKAKDQQEYQAVQESLKLHAGIPFNPDDPNDAALMSTATKHHITIPTNYGQIKPNLVPHVPQTFDRKNKDGTITHMLSDDFGKTWREGPLSAAPDKTDSSGFTNAQIQQNIGELQTAMKQLGQPPPTEIDDIRVSGDKSYIVGKKTNPAYTEWQKRTDDYSKEIQGWRGKLKAGKASSGLTIQGAIDHFKTVNKRAPTSDEIVNMQGALDAMP